MTKTEDAETAPMSGDEPSGRPPAGPGWFDSSWDLGRGLEVREEPPDDALPREWLERRRRHRQAGKRLEEERVDDDVRKK